MDISPQHEALARDRAQAAQGAAAAHAAFLRAEARALRAEMAAVRDAAAQHEHLPAGVTLTEDEPLGTITVNGYCQRCTASAATCALCRPIAHHPLLGATTRELVGGWPAHTSALAARPEMPLDALPVAKRSDLPYPALVFDALLPDAAATAQRRDRARRLAASASATDAERMSGPTRYLEADLPAVGYGAYAHPGDAEMTTRWLAAESRYWTGLADHGTDEAQDALHDRCALVRVRSADGKQRLVRAEPVDVTQSASAASLLAKEQAVVAPDDDDAEDRRDVPDVDEADRNPAGYVDTYEAFALLNAEPDAPVTSTATRAALRGERWSVPKALHGHDESYVFGAQVVSAEELQARHAEDEAYVNAAF